MPIFYPVSTEANKNWRIKTEALTDQLTEPTEAQQNNIETLKREKLKNIIIIMIAIASIWTIHFGNWSLWKCHHQQRQLQPWQ